MKKLIILSCLLLGINSYSQITIEEERKYSEQLNASLDDEGYIKFIKDVIEFKVSEDNLYEMYYSNNYIEKIGSVQNNREVCSLSDESFKKWAQENLDKTNFSSVEEAVKIFTNYHKYTKQNAQRQKEIMYKLEEYKEKYGLVIDQEIRSDITRKEIKEYYKLFPNENSLANIQ